MPTPGRTCLALMLLIVSLSACTAHITAAPSGTAVSRCQIIFDAGSKGTRLYVYQDTTTGWQKYSGPKSNALADPARAVAGRTMADADQVVDDIVASLEGIRHDGPVNTEGKPEWPAFDWREHCHVDAVFVYGTAGMRIAMQQNASATDALWARLNKRLAEVVGMPVTTRTISGFEEGLFAWLAIREEQPDDDFGVAEMGGASLQVTFPCPQCKASKPVKVKGQVMPVYSYSFLGWGQDEAWKKSGDLPACARGAGLKQPDWKKADCALGLQGLSDSVAFLGEHVRSDDSLRWYLSGAFRYMRETDIEQFCRKGADSGYEPASSCFRAVYQDQVLNVLGLSASSEHAKADWTLGAVVCAATQCLEID